MTSCATISARDRAPARRALIAAMIGFSSSSVCIPSTTPPPPAAGEITGGDGWLSIRRPSASPSRGILMYTARPARSTSTRVRHAAPARGGGGGVGDHGGGGHVAGGHVADGQGVGQSVGGHRVRRQPPYGSRGIELHRLLGLQYKFTYQPKKSSSTSGILWVSVTLEEDERLIERGWENPIHSR